MKVLVLIAALASIPVLAAEPTCRNSEKCFTLGMTDLTVNPQLHHTVGSWPFPKKARVKAYVGDQLRFDWDARNEYYSKREKRWLKQDAKLWSVWETLDGSKDPCTQIPSRPWNAYGQRGTHDEILQPCSAGKVYRIRLISDAIQPKMPDAVLELVVLPADRRPATRHDDDDSPEQAPARPAPPPTRLGAPPQTVPRNAPPAGVTSPAPAPTHDPLIDELDKLL